MSRTYRDSHRNSWEDKPWRKTMDKKPWNKPPKWFKRMWRKIQRAKEKEFFYTYNENMISKHDHEWKWT